jgi:hypothetical protein
MHEGGDLVERAKEQGFWVQPGIHLDHLDGHSITIRRRLWDKSVAEIGDAMRKAERIFWGTPVKGEISISRSQTSDIDHPKSTVISLAVGQVEERFFLQVEPTAKPVREQLVAASMRDRQFDEKVSEELAVDPLLVTWEEELAQIQARADGLEGMLDERKKKLMAEREKLRPSYHFVVSDREI